MNISKKLRKRFQFLDGSWHTPVHCNFPSVIAGSHDFSTLLPFGQHCCHTVHCGEHGLVAHFTQDQAAAIFLITHSTRMWLSTSFKFLEYLKSLHTSWFTRPPPSHFGAILCYLNHLGQFSLVVAMSVNIKVFRCLSPFQIEHNIFLCGTNQF